MDKKIIALLGAGSWGTAIAIHLAQIGHKVLLWGHKPQHVAQMIKDKANTQYLPNVSFPDSLSPLDDLDHCIQQADEVIIAVPSHAFAGLLQKITTVPNGLTWITKGIDPRSHR